MSRSCNLDFVINILILLWWLKIFRHFFTIRLFIWTFFIKDLFHICFRVFFIRRFWAWLRFLVILRWLFCFNLFACLFVFPCSLRFLLYYLAIIFWNKLLSSIIEHYVLSLQIFHGCHISTWILVIRSDHGATANLRIQIFLTLDWFSLLTVVW